MPNQEKQTNADPAQMLVFDNKFCRLKKYLSLLFSLIALVGLGGICYYGYYQVISAISKFGPAIIWTSGKYYIIGAIILFIIFIMLFFNGFPPAKTSYVVKPDILDYTHKRKTTSIAWADINQLQFKLQQKRFIGINGQLKTWANLSAADGKNIKLDIGVNHSETLLSLIREKTYPHLFQSTNQAFLADEPLNFGILNAQKNLGIKYHDKIWSWEDFNNLKVHKGRLTFYQDNKRQSKRFAIEKVNNLDVFLALLDNQGIIIHLGKK